MSAAGPLLSYVALCMTPVLFFGVAAAALDPNDNRLKRAGGWVLQRVARRRLPDAPMGPDPFAVLSVQMRLERLAQEIADLRTNPRRSAGAHHLRVARSAYDDLLDEACRLAGVPAPGPGPVGVQRLRKEAELRLRGWIG